MSLKTDTHVHFAGVLAPHDIIDLGMEYNLPVKLDILKKVGVDVEPYIQQNKVDADNGQQQISIQRLSNQDRTKLERRLAMNLDKQNLFDEMEEVYGNRAFVTKHPEMFRAMLYRIAQRYKEQGVEYATLFDAGIISNISRVRDLHRFLPEIEKETGVKIRFLASLWRHSDIEWNEDEVSRLLPLLKSPYIIGADVMGDETNPIRDLKSPISRLVKYARDHVPYFHMHIHGGENPYYSVDPRKLSKWDHNNVHEGLQIVDDALRDVERGYAADGKIIVTSGSEASPLKGEYGQQLTVVMGHGRYGLFDETLALMKRIGAISNKCLSSNYLLAFAKDLRKTFHSFVDNEIPTYIATDGYGMYGTSIPRELDVARQHGLSDKDLEHVRRSEDALLQEENARFAAKMQIWAKYEADCKAKGLDPFEQLSKDAVYTGPDGNPLYTKEVAAAKAQALEDQKQHLFDALHQINSGLGDDKKISSNEDEIHRLLETKKVFGFFGGSKGWDDEKRSVSKENVIKTEQSLRDLIFSVDGSTHTFMTGGTDFGFEKIVHRLVEERNQKLPADKRIPVIGLMTLETHIDNGEVRAGTISHALLLKAGHKFATSWMQQPKAVNDIAQIYSARLIIGAGGQVIDNMIIDAADRQVEKMKDNLLLLDGPEGASTSFARDKKFCEKYGIKGVAYDELKGRALPKPTLMERVFNRVSLFLRNQERAVHPNLDMDI